MRNQPLRTRRRFTDQEKNSILEDHFDKGIPVPVLARKHGIHPITLYNWKRKMSEQGNSQVDPKELLKEIEKLNIELKNVKAALGEAVLDKQALQDINKVLKKKYLEQQLGSPKKSSKKVSRKK